jgi:hypothetical protein
MDKNEFPDTSIALLKKRPNSSILCLQEDGSMSHAPFFGGHLMLQHYQKLFHRYRSEGFSGVWC